MCAGLEDAELQEVMTEMDGDGDGQVTLTEFEGWWRGTMGDDDAEPEQPPETPAVGVGAKRARMAELTELIAAGIANLDSTNGVVSAGRTLPSQRAAAELLAAPLAAPQLLSSVLAWQASCGVASASRERRNRPCPRLSNVRAARSGSAPVIPRRSTCNVALGGRAAMQYQCLKE